MQHYTVDFNIINCLLLLCSSRYHDTRRVANVDPWVGQWNMIDKKMVNGGFVEFWTSMNFSKKLRPNLVSRFCEGLVNMCASKGVVVASMDWPEVTKYRGLVSSQHHREEIILDLYKLIQDPRKGSVHRGMVKSYIPLDCAHAASPPVNMCSNCACLVIRWSESSEPIFDCLVIGSTLRMFHNCPVLILQSTESLHCTG
ncbi:hypothetical protein L1049_011447 [Liquidambar formosana]|uniref:Protein argonaute Mid domain-containing protein n=1 Tax=Liquidambar formosana TaxID=63359 RepID=A0AAP0WZT4_LIQFO